MDSTNNGIARGLVLSSVASLDGLRRGRRRISLRSSGERWRLLRRVLRLDCDGVKSWILNRESLHISVLGWLHQGGSGALGRVGVN